MMRKLKGVTLPRFKVALPWCLFALSLWLSVVHWRWEGEERFRIAEVHREYVDGTLGGIETALEEVLGALSEAGSDQSPRAGRDAP